MNAKTPPVTQLFPDRWSAERAYQHARVLGYTGEVSMVMTDETHAKHFGEHLLETVLGSKAAEGAGIGGAIAGTLVAAGAAVAAIGTTLVVPEAGLVLAGPLVAAFAGAGVGAAGGGLLGALIGWGIPEELVKRYHDDVKSGGILMTVKPRSAEDAEQLQSGWRESPGALAER